MKEVDKADIQDIARPEQLQLLFEEVRNLQVQLRELKDDVEIVLENQDKTQNLVKGGKQPKKHIKVKGDEGPGSLVVAKIMKQAREGPDHSGVSSKEADRILQDEGYSRSRQSVLNLLEKIGDQFMNYEVKKGASSKPTTLYYRT